MNTKIISSGGSQWLFKLAALFFIISGMQAASPILNPFFLAIFIAIICWQPLLWLRRHDYFKGFSKGQLITIVMGGLLLIMSLLTILLGASINDFIDNMPVYQEQFTQRQQSIIAWGEQHGFNFLSNSFLEQLLDPTRALQFSADVLGEFGNALTNIMMILLTVVFIMFEAFILPLKFKKAFGNKHLLERSSRVLQVIKQYLWIKTLTSLVTGIAITLWLTFLGVDYAVLWGVVAFMLNFIPSVGPVISAIPPVCLILLQSGFSEALLAIVGLGVIYTVIGDFWEPKLMGQGLGLSLLAIFLSLVFWGWVFGPIGMLLSVPFTIIVKIMLENYESTRWIAIFLSSEEDFIMTQTVDKSEAMAQTSVLRSTAKF